MGKAGALALGYDKSIIEKIPEDIIGAFCGVGNPFSIAPIATGTQVLDVGCGGGIDLFVASQLSGPEGDIHGVDITEAMTLRARTNMQKLGVDNVTIHHISSEVLPFASNRFDVVISNGVINLSPFKAKVFAEIHRVLKPGGRLQFADIILEKPLPPHLMTIVESWSQ